MDWIERAIEKSTLQFQIKEGFLPDSGCTQVFILMSELKTFFSKVSSRLQT
jgi:hypothetical protein